MKKLILLFTIASSLTLTSCDETKKVIDVAGSVQLSGTYNVTAIDGKNVMTLTDKKAFITFAAIDKTIRGNTGCNDFFGSYTLDLYALSFSGIGSTKMYCEEPVMTSERNFMQALNNTGSYGLQDNVLTLYSKTDRSVLLTAKKDTN